MMIVGVVAAAGASAVASATLTPIDTASRGAKSSYTSINFCIGFESYPIRFEPKS